MRYNLILFILVSPAISWGQTQEKILGSWYYCMNDGSYVEVHIENDHFRSFLGDDAFVGDIYFFYLIENDSIKFSRAPLHLQTDYEVLASSIEFLPQDKIILRSKSEIDTLSKLDISYDPQPQSKSVDVSIEWYDQFQKGFDQRLKAASCVDRRPMKEKARDTIDADLGELKEYFEIITYTKPLGDNQYEITNYLSSSNLEEPIYLSTSVIHDLLPPLFWWNPDSNKLIFEHKAEGDSLSINVYDANAKELKLSISGYINARYDDQHLHMNTDFLLYFETLDRIRIRLRALDLNSLKSQIVVEFENWDAYETPKIAKSNWETGEIEIISKGQNLKIEKISGVIRND